jgi:hypothetical protein
MPHVVLLRTYADLLVHDVALVDFDEPQCVVTGLDDHAVTQKDTAVVRVWVVVCVIVKLGQLRDLVADELLVDEAVVLDVVVGGDIFSKRFPLGDVFEVLAVELVDDALGVADVQVAFGVEGEGVGVDFLLLQGLLQAVLNLVGRLGVHVHIKIAEEHIPQVLIPLLDVLERDFHQRLFG